MTPTSNELATDETYADLLTPPKLPSVHTRGGVNMASHFPDGVCGNVGVGVACSPVASSSSLPGADVDCRSADRLHHRPSVAQSAPQDGEPHLAQASSCDH